MAPRLGAGGGPRRTNYGGRPRAAAPPLHDLSLEELRQRRSMKWRRYPADVLPAWVAELDFALAPPVHRALAEAVGRDDTGYANADGLPEAFTAFAAARWGWEVDPQRTLI